MHAGECVRLGIQGIVAEEFEQRAMIGVAPDLESTLICVL